MKLFWYIFPIFAWCGTNSGSILLHNDSTYILTAVIQAADGSYLGQASVQPGQQSNWTSDLNPTGYEHPGNSNYSYTPYTVIWQCPSENIYSMCTNVSPGGYVRASYCSGDHFCAPKKGDKKAPPSTTLKKKT